MNEEITANNKASNNQEKARVKCQVERLVSHLLNIDTFPEEELTGDAQTGIHCGVEDVGCQDRYDGADYGYAEGVRACAEWRRNELDNLAGVINALEG